MLTIFYTKFTPLPSSPTLSTDFEGKKIQKIDRDQLVATCVVNSFINNKRNRTPAILINGKVFIVCLYDCSNDVLLISDTIEYVSETGELGIE